MTDPIEVFMEKMEEDSNYIASRCQIHTNTFSCFKYGQRMASQGGCDIKEKDKPRVPHCHFLFPKQPCQFGVDAKTGDITLEPNHAWANKRNKILSCAFR